MVLMVIAMAMSAERLLRVQPFLLAPWEFGSECRKQRCAGSFAR